jgi:hypothetical protein
MSGDLGGQYCGLPQPIHRPGNPYKEESKELTRATRSIQRRTRMCIEAKHLL